MAVGPLPAALRMAAVIEAVEVKTLQQPAAARVLPQGRARVLVPEHHPACPQRTGWRQAGRRCEYTSVRKEMLVDFCHRHTMISADRHTHPHVDIAVRCIQQGLGASQVASSDRGKLLSHRRRK